jgi:hypothetical protein
MVSIATLRKRVFSLIEVTISLALFVFLATLYIIHGSYLQRLLVRSEIEKMYAICMYLQRYAMLSNRTHVLIFDVKGQKYCFNGRTENLPRGVRFGFLPGVCGPPSTLHSKIKEPITFQAQRIVFHPDGIIQPGSVYLVGSEYRYMYAMSSAVAHVSHLRKYEYAAGWSHLS